MKKFDFSEAFGKAVDDIYNRVIFEATYGAKADHNRSAPSQPQQDNTRGISEPTISAHAKMTVEYWIGNRQQGWNQHSRSLAQGREGEGRSFRDAGYDHQPAEKSQEAQVQEASRERDRGIER